MQPRLDPTTGKPFVLDYDQLFADPITARILGTRHTQRALLSLIYSFHYTLLVPGGWGKWFLVVVALLWVFDCFLGLYLTFPRARPFFRRWQVAWKIKQRAGAYRRNFDLHRAGGLWFWGVLLVHAVSSVSFNLSREVFRPAVSFFSPLAPSPLDQRRDRPVPASLEPTLSFDEAVARAKAEAERRGWPLSPSAISYVPTYSTYVVNFRPSRHNYGLGLGPPSLYFDALDGHLIGQHVPGEGKAGDVFPQLQFPLHSGRIAGWSGRMVICLTGAIVAMLSLTGVSIWWKKRSARIAAKSAPTATS